MSIIHSHTHIHTHCTDFVPHAWDKLQGVWRCDPKGHDVLTSCFPVRRQLVSSYEGKFGSVQYYVRAMMERASQPTLEAKKNFEVEEPLDVNTPDLLVRNALVCVATSVLFVVVV